MATYAPTQGQAAVDYVVSACLQRMDAYYLRDRQAYRRGQGAHHEVAEALHGPSSGQLTISDNVFRMAEALSVGAAERASSARAQASHTRT